MNKDATKKRLSKFLAAAGVASRRACEEMIFVGRISVNGEVVKEPQHLVNEKDNIIVDGKALNAVEPKVYYILNKPVGYVCTARQSCSTKIVLDLFKEIPYRLFTVGRLDKDTEGLIIVTNDGHFANRVIHPSSGIRKEYLAKTNVEITADHLSVISNGTLVEGVFVKPLRVTKVRRGTVKIAVGEGKKREVRMLLESAGLIVQELTRIRIGNLQLGQLPVGSWREMTEQEKTMIFE